MRVLPLLCCLLLASASASAQNVYKWKDANGVTQYSEKPPANQKAEQRRITTRDPVTTGRKAEAPAESADCSQSRKNLALLNGQGEVMYDTDGDGKPETPLTADQRKAQKSMAEAGIQAYCPPAA
ncbi:DUF4124 domain-containing protein [Stenotrophomonas sp. 278]|uniref:DUF4124 domain-containing protein n=1 Tax=Stenotrophomonas sp. 278 TaxID=2479851 RepID=UPI000F66B7A6|nr:DUF4124 domain-containing protein [Stenotrophomonas sp. 278]RRU12322.1 DUF4124 domain-containing protein [Stenotrophomonas sp. 278]